MNKYIYNFKFACVCKIMDIQITFFSLFVVIIDIPFKRHTLGKISVFIKKFPWIFGIQFASI